MQQTHQNGTLPTLEYGSCKELNCNCEALIPVEGEPNRCTICSHDSFIHAVLGPTESPPPPTPPPNIIWFYNRNEKYYEFTNFKEGYPIVAALVQPQMGERPDVRSWPTSEHLFQAAKFKKYPSICELIMNSKTARDALNIARNFHQFVDPNWQEINIQVMEWVVTQKFEQHPGLARMLVETGDQELVEHTEVDNFWGDGGGPNKGRNELGKVLMR
ncbi:4825_t:CDS:2 [Diversispora eburnea]|uniref:4825_t:CDS:1 n=1 Tax=Diversispora eburnea TaxID=1213867 RepID=A0A9N9B1C2_9GLOM|nr:4825_t:CDS:2 [Diversispora eburnea]